VKVLAPQHPEWKEKEPFASLLKGDLKGALAGGEHALIEITTPTRSANGPTIARHTSASSIRGLTKLQPEVGQLWT